MRGSLAQASPRINHILHKLESFSDADENQNSLYGKTNKS